MNEQKIFSLIVYFNKRNGKRHQASSESLQNMFKVAIQNFGEETVEEIIKNVKSDSIYKVLDLMFIEEYVKNKAPKEVETKVEVKDGVEIRYIEKIKIVEVDRIVEVPKIIEVIKEVATPSMTLGILEEAMATVLTEKYVPVIAKQVNEQVDNYVKATYGPVKQEVIFAHNGKVLEGEIFHNEFETVMNFVLADEPLMLVGPAGSGKNVICKQVADLLDTEFYFTNAVTQEHKLTGYKDAMGKYHETEFYKAFTKGGLFMLDEIDASIPEVLVILNAAIANRYFDFPTGKVNAHPDFRIISAGNTFGHGASYQYVGRNQLDGASLNRFAVLEIGYSEQIEDAICADTELVSFIRGFRKAVEDAGINHIVSYRELTRLDKMLSSSTDNKKLFKTCLIKNLEKEDIKIIKGDLDSKNKYYKYI